MLKKKYQYKYRIANGLPIGSNIDYADESTFVEIIRKVKKKM
ncbi:MAG: hypothetical protein ACLTAI_13740 [Thomasclavelia sp.]